MSRALMWLRANYYVWMPFMIVVIGFGCCIAYTNYAIHKSDQELCEVLTPLDDAYQHATTPLSGTGQKIATAIHDQVLRRGCDAQ